MRESAPATIGGRRLLPLPENQFARAALSRLTESRLVFLCGPPGVGKSHLIRHSLDELHQISPLLNIVSLTASQFAATLAEASDQNSVAEFQSSLRLADLLVCEEITALARRHQTQTQLVQLIDDVLAKGGSIVLSSRLAPRDLDGFSPRLINRCRGGTLAGVVLPGRDSRIRLLEHFAESRRLPVSEGMPAVLADALPASPRELLSTVLQLESLSRLERRPVDHELITRLLDLDEQPPAPTLQRIAQAVAREFEVSVACLRDTTRSARLTTPRHCAMLLARTLTRLPLRLIAAWFGRTNHSSVVHACRKIEATLVEDAALQQRLARVRTAIGRIDLGVARPKQVAARLRLSAVTRKPR